MVKSVAMYGADVWEIKEREPAEGRNNGNEILVT